ncbi:unnamed protein product [Ixodes pacificus]
MRIQSSCPPWGSGWLTTLPLESKPRMSLPTLEVRPDSTSCLCRNSFCRARPRPLSSSPWVSTPSRVLLPASTLPTTATLGRPRERFLSEQTAHLTSTKSFSLALRRTRYSAASPSPDFRSRSSTQSHSSVEAMLWSVATDAAISSDERPGSP